MLPDYILFSFDQVSSQTLNQHTNVSINHIYVVFDYSAAVCSLVGVYSSRFA